MPTQADRDGDNSARVSASISLRSFVIVAALSTFASSTVPQCTNRDDEIVRKIEQLEQKFDDRLDRMAETQARLGERVASVEGSRGRGSIQ